MASKRIPEPHEVLMYNSESRPPRKRASGATSPGGGRPPLRDITGSNDMSEAMHHREAIKELEGADYAGLGAWRAVQALLFVYAGGDRIDQHACVWLFPDESQRFLACVHENGKEYYVIVRRQGQRTLDKISLGVCEQDGVFYPSRTAHGAGSGTEVQVIDPEVGVVVRIVSIEKDGDPLLRPHEILAVPSMARHIADVIRKQTAKCGAIASSENLHGPLLVLRSKAYLDARDKLVTDDCAADEWHAALEAMHADPASPWDLVNRVASLGLMDRLTERAAELDKVVAASQVGTGDARVHVVDDIFLVEETLPLASHEFVVAAPWAVRKSIKGTGSIPKSKMWEPVVVQTRQGHETFQLVRFA